MARPARDPACRGLRLHLDREAHAPRPRDDRRRRTRFLYLLAQGFAIGPRGLSHAWLVALLGPVSVAQTGLGLGAAFAAAAFAMLFATGIAERGAFRGDPFVACCVVAVSVLVATFTFYPVAAIVGQALQDAHGALSLDAFSDRLFTPKIWSLGCVAGQSGCGVAWNTLILAVLCATASTALGLAFALIVTRTGFRFKKALRTLSVLPIITPPFVIGLGLILIFGRSGLVNQRSNGHSTSSRRGGSTASPACSSRRCSRSRRLRSWC